MPLSVQDPGRRCVMKPISCGTSVLGKVCLRLFLSDILSGKRLRFELGLGMICLSESAWSKRVSCALTSSSFSPGVCAGVPPVPADSHGGSGRAGKHWDRNWRLPAGERGEGDHHGVCGPCAEIPLAKPGGGGRRDHPCCHHLKHTLLWPHLHLSCHASLIWIIYRCVYPHSIYTWLPQCVFIRWIKMWLHSPTQNADVFRWSVVMAAVAWVDGCTHT